MTANSNKATLQILVDADSCPVKDLVVSLGEKYGCDVVLVASLAHYTDDTQLNWVFVDKVFQGVDIVIINRLNPGDIVITQDYGLAAMVLAKGGYAISPRGQRYNDEDINLLLEQRNDLVRLRRGGYKTKGPRAMTHQDRSMFTDTLNKIIISEISRD